MFKTLMDFLGYEKKKSKQTAPKPTETHNRLYRYIAREDLATYQAVARLENIDLRVVKSSADWVTLLITPAEVYKIEAHGLHLAR